MTTYNVCAVSALALIYYCQLAVGDALARSSEQSGMPDQRVHVGDVRLLRLGGKVHVNPACPVSYVLPV